MLQVEVRARDIDVWRALKPRVLACFEGAAIATGCSWEWEQTEHPYAPVAPDTALAALWDANIRARGREPVPAEDGPSGGSTDMGNVTQVLPAIHPMIALRGETGTIHSAAFTASAATPAAADAVIDAATVMAWTAIDAALIPSVRADLRQRRARRPAGATRVTLQA